MSPRALLVNALEDADQLREMIAVGREEEDERHRLVVVKFAHLNRSRSY